MCSVHVCVRCQSQIVDPLAVICDVKHWVHESGLAASADFSCFFSDETCSQELVVCFTVDGDSRPNL